MVSIRFVLLLHTRAHVTEIVCSLCSELISLQLSLHCYFLYAQSGLIYCQLLRNMKHARERNGAHLLSNPVVCLWSVGFQVLYSVCV